MKGTILLAVATLALAACDYGQTGKPVRQETRATGETVLVYEKKTFDSGQFEYWGIEFIPL